MKTGKLLFARTKEGMLDLIAEAEKASELVALLETPEIRDVYDMDTVAIITSDLGMAQIIYDAKAHRRANKAQTAKAEVKPAKKKAAKKAPSLEDVLGS